jgi:HSP20 family protein
MERLFDSTAPRLSRGRARFPAVNVWTNDQEGVIVSAELPGVASDSLDITVTADTLTISGERKPTELPENARYHRRERYCAEFNRTVQLPYTVSSDQVEAALENGVLQITLPRAEAEKPKQITIKTSA